jgi:flagellar protein FlaJ
VASIAGLAYQRFGWLSKGLLWLLYGGSSSKLRDRLEAAGMRIYPEAYLSVVGLFLVLASALVATVVALTRFIPVLVLPVIVLLVGYALPIIKAQDRASKLDAEAPFVAAYVSVMATGGLPPYASLRKLKNCDLLPNTAKVARQMEVDVMLKGLDPVAAIEKSAERLPSKEFREFLTWLHVHVEDRGRCGPLPDDSHGGHVQGLGDEAEGLRRARSHTLGVLHSRRDTLQLGPQHSLPHIDGLQGLPPRGASQSESFLMYSYIVMPVLSIFFIYLADISSFQEPGLRDHPIQGLRSHHALHLLPGHGHVPALCSTRN